MENKWSNPQRRSYQEIKSDLISKLTSINGPDGSPLITDISEGNILIIIISLFASLAETLHFYIDNMAREFFLTSARRYSSVSAIGKLFDYKPRAANAATVDVVLTRELDGIKSATTQVIKSGTLFIDSKNNTWMVNKDTIWAIGQTLVKVPCTQRRLYTSSTLNGVEVSESNILILDTPSGDEKIEHRSIDLTILTPVTQIVNGLEESTVEAQKWTQVDTFAYSSPEDYHFRLYTDDGKYILEFGDGKFGRPLNLSEGSSIQIVYYLTKGKAGNIGKGSITQVPSSIAVMGKNVKAYNPFSTADGQDIEDIDTLRNHISLRTRTMEVAITKQDFVDLAKSYPGVKDAAAEYVCGKKLNLYIRPGDLEVSSEESVNEAISSDTLLDNIKNFILSNSPMATWLNVYAAGITYINLEVDVTGKPSFTKLSIQNDIISALTENYSMSNTQIGGKVRLSDIYALIDNLQSVDYLTIKKFFITPWPTIVYGNVQLELGYNLDKASGITKYLISFNTTTYSIYSLTGGYKELNISRSVNSITVDDLINNNRFSLVLKNIDSIMDGSKYIITVYSPNHDYDEQGYNSIVFNSDNLNLNITEVL